MKKLIVVLLCTLFYSASYAQPHRSHLKKLNEYLTIFNPETYRAIEVKDHKVYFRFAVYSTIYESSIDISELKQNTTTLKVNFLGTDEIKIMCKGESKCFYSTYSKSNADHFRFFSKTEKDLTKMETLLNKFIKSLK